MATTKTTAKKPATAAAKPAAKKPAAAKPAAAKAPAKKATTTAAKKPAAKRAPAAKKVSVTPEQRYRMIAEAAYYHAERRGFAGDPVQDWIAAEAEINARLGEK